MTIGFSSETTEARRQQIALLKTARKEILTENFISIDGTTQIKILARFLL